MKSMDDIAKSCVYCGRIAAEPTRDHIPPKSLFNKPRPANLITVCACGCCNERFRKDEDYFWLTLSSRSEAARNPEAGDASFRAIQNLARPEATGFRSAFLGTVRSLAVKTASGLYVGNTLTYDVSFPRLNRMAAKITRGLFCFETKGLLAANYLATARALDQFTESPEDKNLQRHLQQLLAHAAAEQPHSVGRVFSYRFKRDPDDPQSSITLFHIYETTAFLGLTIKRSDRPDKVWTEWA